MYLNLFLSFNESIKHTIFLSLRLPVYWNFNFFILQNWSPNKYLFIRQVYCKWTTFLFPDFWAHGVHLETRTVQISQVHFVQGLRFPYYSSCPSVGWSICHNFKGSLTPVGALVNVLSNSPSVYIYEYYFFTYVIMFIQNIILLHLFSLNLFPTIPLLIYIEYERTN